MQHERYKRPIPPHNVIPEEAHEVRFGLFVLKLAPESPSVPPAQQPRDDNLVPLQIPALEDSVVGFAGRFFALLLAPEYRLGPLLVALLLVAELGGDDCCKSGLVTSHTIVSHTSVTG